MDKILLAHGSGGKLYHQLIDEIFLPAFGNKHLNQLNDSAVCPVKKDLIAMTTDSFVVQPLFFPGGDIGRLAVCGTVNDLTMSGAIPRYLTLGMIIEADFPFADLKRICASIAAAAKEAGVQIVTGDTKVVQKGHGDGIYINTAGVGELSEALDLSQRTIEAGDVIICSGEIASHGIAVLSAREGLGLCPEPESDVAPLNGLAQALLSVVPQTKALRDPTRGGLASTLNEWAEKAGLTIEINEGAVPINKGVAATCELLGLDPLHVANEGKFLACVPAAAADTALAALKSHQYGVNAALIGKVTEDTAARLQMTTLYGGTRIIDIPAGELLPRIC